MSLIERLYKIGMSEETMQLNEPRAEFKPSRRSTLLENYDPTAYPPDLTFAAEHGRSRIVGRSIPPLQNVQRCRCCLQPIHKQKLPLLCNLSQLQHCGESTPFYFVFLKQIILLLACNCLIITLPAVLINFLMGSECQHLNGERGSILNSVCRSSVINIMNVQVIDAMQIEAVVFFLAVIINILLIAYLQVKMEGYVGKANRKKSSAADYSFIIKGLPSDITITEIQKYVQDKLALSGATNVDVVKIYLIYNFKDYLKLLKRKQSNIEKKIGLQFEVQKIDRATLKASTMREKAKLQEQREKIISQVIKLDGKLQKIETRIQNFEEITSELTEKLKHFGTLQYEQLNKKLLNFSGKCIITINNKQSRDCLVYGYQTKSFYQRFTYWLSELLEGRKSKIMIAAAPEPSDILFGNMGSRKTTVWKKRMKYSLLICLLILLDFLMVALTKKFLKEEKTIQKGNILFSFLNSIIVSLFCSIFRKIVGSSEEESCYPTLSQLCHKKLVKMVVIFQINMLFTTFVANVASFYLIRQDKPTFDIFPLNFEAFLFDIFFLIVTNPIITLVMTYFDQRHIRALIKKYRIQKGYLAVSQAQANTSFQNINFDICFKYGMSYRFLLFCGGIGIIYPFCFIICFFAITLLYWMDKYLLLRRYSITQKLTSQFTLLAQKVMGQFPIYLSLTNLLVMFIPIEDGSAFKSQKYSKIYYYLSISAVMVSCLCYFGGNGWIRRSIRRRVKCENELDQDNTVLYKDIESTLLIDYSHDYPYFRVTKKVGSDQTDFFRQEKLTQLSENQKIGVFQVLHSYVTEEDDS